MYRTNDPRFRRRLNEIGQTLESANETAQSGIYIFGQTYVKPCFESIGSCFTDCVEAGCPSLNLRNRDRLRRQRGQTRTRGRAELSFDFYDDWDEEENDGLLGWGNDEFDRLLAGSGGYGTVTNAQPGRQRGMSYPKTRRKSNHDIGEDPTVITGSSGFLNRLFGGKTLRYKPSAAGLQEHPGARRLGGDVAEGEPLLEDSEVSETGGRRKSTRNRSGTSASADTQDTFSSRGDLFASDDEEDAVPIDDEFAMVLERRTTNSGNASGHDTENSSDKTREQSARRGKRASAASRQSSRRTTSTRSLQSTASGPHSRTSSSAALAAQSGHASPVEIMRPAPTLEELQQEDEQVAAEEEADIAHKRREAQELAAHRGLVVHADIAIRTTDKTEAEDPASEPSQLPTPVPTDDETSDRGAPQSST